MFRSQYSVKKQTNTGVNNVLSSERFRMYHSLASTVVTHSELQRGKKGPHSKRLIYSLSYLSLIKMKTVQKRPRSGRTPSRDLLRTALRRVHTKPAALICITCRQNIFLHCSKALESAERCSFYEKCCCCGRENDKTNRKMAVFPHV